MERKIHTYSLVVERREDGGFYARFPALPGCRAEGLSYEGTVQAAEEALALYVQDILDADGRVPDEQMMEPVSLSVSVLA